MSIHPSLKTASGALQQHRNVLTRPERIARLSSGDRFDPAASSALGLPKVRSIKASTGKKPKKAEEGGEAAPAKGGKAAKGGK